MSKDEADVWRQATSGAKPLRNRAQAQYLTRPAPDRATVRQRLAETAARPLKTDYMAPSSNPALEKHLDRAQLKRLKRGRLPIEGRLDLHGMTAREAERNLCSFLRASQQMGRRAVLVITGRGVDTTGTGKGVLKRETPQWLARLPDVVTGHAQADQRHGGAGALYVTLRRIDRAR